MTIAERIIELLSARAERSVIGEVRIGLGYTAVTLSDGGTGVALTFLPREQHCCEVVDNLHPVAGRPAADLLGRLASPDPIGAALGLACANALVNRPGPGLRRGDVLELIDIRPEDRVAMVGNFKPLAVPIGHRAASLTVFEKISKPENGVLPAAEAVKRLPGCQLAIITATTIINHTVDELLAAASACREVVILGASTPLLPEIFEGFPVSCLSGVLVKDTAGVLQAVSAGGGMRAFKHHVTKVNLQIG